MKGYCFLDGSLFGQRTYLLSLPREEPQVIFAIPAKERFAGACAACDLLCPAGRSDCSCHVMAVKWKLDEMSRNN